jgi:hypothetical protein
VLQHFLEALVGGEVAEDLFDGGGSLLEVFLHGEGRDVEVVDEIVQLLLGVAHFLSDLVH